MDTCLKVISLINLLSTNCGKFSSLESFALYFSCFEKEGKQKMYNTTNPIFSEDKTEKRTPPNSHENEASPLVNQS